LLPVGGVIASFAKGAFISLCIAFVFIWYKFQKKGIATIILLLFGILVITLASFFHTGNSYWHEMSTIEGSYKEDVGRLFLWKKAFEMFVSHPIFGVGPSNFGFVLPKITTADEIEPRNVKLSDIYGRVPHNIYFQILSELGLLGGLAFMIIVYSFWKKNRDTQRFLKKQLEFPNDFNEDKEAVSLTIRKNHYYALGIEGAFLTYLVGSLFYCMLYVNWLPDILILNNIIYINSGESKVNTRIPR